MPINYKKKYFKYKNKYLNKINKKVLSGGGDGVEDCYEHEYEQIKTFIEDEVKIYYEELISTDLVIKNNFGIIKERKCSFKKDPIGVNTNVGHIFSKPEFFVDAFLYWLVNKKTHFLPSAKFDYILWYINGQQFLLEKKFNIDNIDFGNWLESRLINVELSEDMLNKEIQYLHSELYKKAQAFNRTNCLPHRIRQEIMGHIDM
tara:strand:- start:3126 stop:3734 length:609 start_codon:yes stop_codon:yes gene_type:complete